MASAKVKKIAAIRRYESIAGCRAGRIARVDEQGRVFVDFEGNPGGPQAARVAGDMCARLSAADSPEGEEVLLVFENDDPGLPIVVDSLHPLVAQPDQTATTAEGLGTAGEVLVDGKRVCFEAEEEIAFRCGKAELLLTRAGKVLIRGAYLFSHSSGVNRIQGASVWID